MKFSNITSDEIDNIMEINNIMKFNEQKNLKDVADYVEKTYSGHYTSANGVQSMDLISSSGRGLDFCLGNVLKYASRYGKKNGANREDLMKIIHYTLLAMNEHDIKETNETRPTNT
jgi:hypothetical protein|tara:strand:- start:56 stop:403 length:348 start_codon:yes stop_codon:yes gene_type:complete